MLLRHSFDRDADATRIEAAAVRVLQEGARTADLARPGEAVLSTGAMGERVRRVLDAAPEGGRER
jgi:3-isopropylmalate dehydrogenase